MKYLCIFTALLALGASADIEKAPKSFATESGKAVFVDFSKADYTLVYDVESKSVTVTSKITFRQSEEGFPLFDLIKDPESVSVNGSPVKVSKITDPDGQTSFRLVEKPLAADTHEMLVRHSFDANTKFASGSVASGFWMSDLTDRKYLEQYLPTNMEYDRYKMTLDAQVINASEEHEVFTNGESVKLNKNHFKIVFPKYFTSSSVYFHLNKKDAFLREDFSFTSMNGSEVPVVVYSRSAWNMRNIKNKVLDILNELEAKFGAWGHPSLTIYIAGAGGMEHSGATITSLRALGHELIHSYFARGVMPISGDSGWLDEAIASWRDDGYQSRQRPFYRSTQMSGFSQYKRTTDRKAYTEGASFMAYLNNQLEENGGLAAFLAMLYENYLHNGINTATFEKELAAFSGKDFSGDFKKYVFGREDQTKSAAESGFKKAHGHENPYHPKLTKKQLLDLL